VFTRPAKTVRPPLAVPPRPGPAPRCSSHLPGLWVTRHQRGFTHVRPSGLPLACAPGWNGSASASSLSFAPRSYPRRTSGRGLALNTSQKLCHRHHRPSSLHAHSQHATSCRTISAQSSARPAMAYTPASLTSGGLSLPSCSAVVANRSLKVRVRCSPSVWFNFDRFGQTVHCGQRKPAEGLLDGRAVGPLVLPVGADGGPRVVIEGQRERL
jgi:hypothetical protein